jgi:hypothetical protein
MSDSFGLAALHPAAKGLLLQKHVGDRLIACELVMFDGGRDAVHTMLRRAAVAGRMELEPADFGDMAYFADVYTSDCDWEQTVILDRRSYGALKNKWMRTPLSRPPASGDAEG